jgi:hypothetical protein
MQVQMRQLGSVAQVYAGIPTRADRQAEQVGARRFLSVRALHHAHLIADDLIDATPAVQLSDKYAARTGDVIIPARSTFFTAAVLPQALDGVVINATLIGIRCGAQIHPHLLAAYLRHPIGRAAIDELSQSGTAQMNITVRALATLKIPVPPRDAQDRIARMLEAADAAYNAAIHAAERRHSVAHEVALQAMSGLTVEQD